MAQLKSTSVTGNLSVTGNVVASQIIKLDGTSDHILMSDGGIQNLNNFNHSIIFKQNNDLINQYNINNVNLLTATNISIISSNLNDSAYDRIYVGKNNNCSLQYRTKREFLKDLNLTLVYNFKGTVNNINALKNIFFANIGDVYSILDTGDNWACHQAVTSATGDNYETYWSNLGKNVDLSGYMTLDTNQTITGQKTFTTVKGIMMTGENPITFPTTDPTSSKPYHYLSAGSGYGINAGRYGVKLICCDQYDAITGIGQDLSNRGNGYDLSIVSSASAGDGHCTISFVTNNFAKSSSDSSISFSYTTLGYWTEGGHLHAEGTINSKQLNLHRVSGPTGGRISFYNGGGNNYTTWFEYMSDCAAESCTTGGTPSSYGEVTSWARRSIVENNNGYGWIWESISGPAATGNPDAVMSLHANNGNLALKGSLTLASSATFQYNTADKCIDVLFT